MCHIWNQSRQVTKQFEQQHHRFADQPAASKEGISEMEMSKVGSNFVYGDQVLGLDKETFEKTKRVLPRSIPREAFYEETKGTQVVVFGPCNSVLVFVFVVNCLCCRADQIFRNYHELR